MDEELKNEYVKCGLDYIRKYIRMSIQDFDYGNSLVADLEIKKELENFYDKLIIKNNNKSKFKVKNRGYTPEEYNVLRKLSIKYYAICNDNLSLWKKLSTEHYLFGNQNVKFFALDKNFTKYFSEDELVFLLKHCNSECENFFSKLISVSSKRIDNDSRGLLLDSYYDISDRLLYDSKLDSRTRKDLEDELSCISKKLNKVNVYKYSDDDRDNLMMMFRQVILQNPGIAKKNDKHDISKTFRNLLVPDNFLIFGSEMLLNLSYYQREMVNENYNGKNIIPMIKLRDILLKNSDFYTRLHFTEEILNVFSDQEIIDMTPKLERIFSKADNIGHVGRVRNIVLGAGVELDDKFVDPDFLNALSDEQIKELSVVAKEKIKKVLLNKRKFITIYGDRYRLIKKIRGIEMFDTVMQSVGLRRK